MDIGKIHNPKCYKGMNLFEFYTQPNRFQKAMQIIVNTNNKITAGTISYPSAFNEVLILGVTRAKILHPLRPTLSKYLGIVTHGCIRWSWNIYNNADICKKTLEKSVNNNNLGIE